MTRIAPALAVLCLAAPTNADDPTWAALARNDLRGIRDLLRDNHPGPVDPENSRYREWLEDGLTRAIGRSETARSYSDYVRALRFYTNGFRDGHIGIGLEVSPEEVDWPGFVVGASADGDPEVVQAEADSGVRTGDRITGCDGRSIDDLMKDRVDPYFWNAAIPHERGQHLHHLFELNPSDSLGRLASCRFSSGDVALKWRRASREDYARTLEGAGGPRSREPRLHRVDGVWFVSTPTFAYSSDAAVRQIRALLADLGARAPELRPSRVVFDVRKNRGGNSAWGREIARVFWGSEWVSRVESGFDDTMDWRASDANIRFMASLVDRDSRAGLSEAAGHSGRALEAMTAARSQGRDLARVEDRPRPIEGPPPPNPVSGRAFLLTDHECASACLDFADLIRRLPGVTHVGLPTSADAIYIDNTYALLRTGLAGLGYSMKVHRNRVRRNNEWYEPVVRWPGGSMTDDAVVARWLASLP